MKLSTVLIALITIGSVSAAITIPAIPDVTPGTSIVMPVTIEGNGVFTLEIPKLPFGTYEIPGPVTVHGTRTVPVLLRIDKDAKPGVYTVPVRSFNEIASARIRIIEYKQTNYWWSLIPIGIILIIIGILLFFQRTRVKPSRPATKSTDEMITYY